MKFQRNEIRFSFFVVLIMVVFSIQCSFGQINSENMDPALLMTNDLQSLVENVWCNGINYTALCQWGSNLEYCLGEVFQEEFTRIKHDNTLHIYDKEKLGTLLSRFNCNVGDNLGVEEINDGDTSIYWIVILIFFCLTALGTLAHFFMRRCGKFSSCHIVCPVIFANREVSTNGKYSAAYI